jgi:hypothetical protein
MCEPWEAYAKWHKPVTKKKEKKKKDKHGMILFIWGTKSQNHRDRK